MKILIEFSRRHPWRSVVVVACLLVAGVAEGLGLSTVLPFVRLAMEEPGGAAEGGSESLEHVVLGILAHLGLEANLGNMLGLIVVVFALKGVLLLLARRQVGYTIARVVTELRLRLVRALFRANWSYYVTQRVGTFANAFTTEARRAGSAYENSTLILTYTVEILVFLGIALWISWMVTLGAVGLGGAVALVLWKFVRMAGRAGRRQTKIYHRLLGTFTDLLQGVKPVKAMGRENLVSPLLEEGTRKLEKAMRKEVTSKAALISLQDPVVVALLAVGLFVLLREIGMDVARVGVLALLLWRAMGAFNTAQRRYQKMSVDESAYWSLCETIEQAEAQEEHTTGNIEATLEDAIEFANVSFGYPNHRVFENLSLRIPVGMITALTGPSGAGKTTVVDLVTGMAHPERGEVLIDGHPLKEVDLHAWRGRIGYVPQESFLLHESIATNITLGDPNISNSDIEHALREAHAWEFVSRMPEGVDSIVGERGAALSGGQRQRLCIARALVHHPRLLILDEATAALDSDSEAEVWRVIEELRHRTTVLAISHQPALLGVADRVYRVVDGGASPIPDAVPKS